MSITELMRIDRTVDIAAPRERVYRALTDQGELAAWFQVTIEGEIRAGGAVWMTSTNVQYAGHRFRVRFIELTPPSRVVWQWHPGEVDPTVDYSKEPETTVTFTLERSGKGTRLRVSETGFDEISLARRAKVHADNTQGWAEVLEMLKKYVEAAG